MKFCSSSLVLLPASRRRLRPADADTTSMKRIRDLGIPSRAAMLETMVSGLKNSSTVSDLRLNPTRI